MVPASMSKPKCVRGAHAQAIWGDADVRAQQCANAKTEPLQPVRQVCADSLCVEYTCFAVGSSSAYALTHTTELQTGSGLHVAV